MSDDWSADSTELRRLIEAREIGLREAMQWIAEGAARVANASGVAVALLKADELVYEACVGTAVVCSGQRMMATLSTSTALDTGVEILRVEDADTDTRIQAAICRQFEARSLLILPLYSGPLLSGVLQISFEQAHEFSEPELQDYWTLARLGGQALSLSSDCIAAFAPHAGAMGAIPLLEAPAPTAGQGGPMPVREEPDEDAVFASAPVSVGQSPSLPAEVICGPWPQMVVARFFRAWDAGIAAAVLIAAFVLVLYRDATPPALSKGGVTFDGSHTAEPAEPESIKPADPPPTAPLEGSSSPPELLAPPARRVTRLASHVEYFGDDVTVRHLPAKVAVAQHGREGTVRRLSDDVTVRYYDPQAIHIP